MPVNRRGFLKAAGSAAAVAGTAMGLARGTASAAAAVRAYPHARIAKAKPLVTGRPIAFSYPDAESPCFMLKTGRSVPGGAGPDSDIVAFSAICTHQGCALSYDEGSRTFKCPCHFSIFDPEMGGQMVCGQAAENLPQILLEYDPADDSVRAVGVRGLIYGRRANIV